MPKHGKDRIRKKRAAGSDFLGFGVVADGDLSKEKERAKKLRNTSWWSKKCAGGVCHYCGEKFPPAELTMDHLIPLTRGGTSERFNLVHACKECNNKKKYLLPTEWEEHINKIKNQAKKA